MSTFARRQRRILTACAVVIGVLAVAGCASPYGENMLFGGYRSERLDASHWLVQYDGNGHTPREQVWAYWMYRCAEVTRQNGYAYYAMLPATWTPPAPAPAAAAAAPAAWQDGRSASSMTRPAVWAAGGSVRAVQARSSGGHTSYIYVPGAAYNITTWHTKGVVAMFNAPVAPDTLLVMNAQSVLDDLGPYVQGKDPHPLDREALVVHGLRWVSDSGAVLPLMAPPAAAPASAPRSPVSFAPRNRHAELAS